MNKKRGIVISTTDNTKFITKSKSDSNNPLSNPLHNRSLNDNRADVETRLEAMQHLECEELAESNLLSDVPAGMINQAHYLLQQPDYAPHHENDKCEENDQQIIESMHKKKELLEIQRRQLERLKNEQKNKNSQTAIDKQKKQKQTKQKQNNRNEPYKGKTTPHKQCKNPCFKKNVDKTVHKKNIPPSENVIKKQMSMINLKPKPLQFNANILDKMYKHSRNRRQENQIHDSLLQKLQLLKPTLTVRSSVHDDLMAGENFNCKKMPFRFQGIL